MAKLIMEDAKGKQKKVPLGFSWSMLFFGPLVPAFRKQELHLFFSILLIIPTFGISWVAYPWFINFFWRRELWKKGYRPIDVEGMDTLTLLRRTAINLEDGPVDADTIRNGKMNLAFTLLNGVPLAVFLTVVFRDELELMMLQYRDPQAYAEAVKTDLETLETRLAGIDPNNNRALEEAHRRLYVAYRDQVERDPSNAEAEQKARHHKERMEHYKLQADADRYCIGRAAEEEAYDALKSHINRDLFEIDKVAYEAFGILYRHPEFPPFDKVQVTTNREACSFRIIGQYETERSTNSGKSYERVDYEADLVRGFPAYRGRVASDPWKIWRINVNTTREQKSDDGVLWEDA